MSATRPLVLETYLDPPTRSQDPRFIEVQAAVRSKHPEQFTELRDIAVRLAAQVGSVGFTPDDLMEVAGGRARFVKNMPGVVLGNLRQRHALCVIGREKSRHPARKGAWVNRFALNGSAIRVEG